MPSPWLEDWGPRFALLLAGDDATGTAVNSLFRPGEDIGGRFLMTEGTIRGWGLPLAIYGDRHGVFQFNGRPRRMSQPIGPTQFSRAMGELGIQQIFTRSPQAEGRV
jgi:hypothetical protein